MPPNFQDARIGSPSGFFLHINADGSVNLNMTALTPTYPIHCSHAVATINTWERFLACAPLTDMRKWTLKMREPAATPFDYSFIAAPTLSWMSAAAGGVVNQQAEFLDLYVRCTALQTLDIELWYELAALPALPTITGIVPPTGAQGTAALAVAIAGTSFTTAMQIAVGGAGVAVTSFVRTTDVLIDAVFTIDAAAALGARTITIRNLGGEVVSAAIFTVVP